MEKAKKNRIIDICIIVLVFIVCVSFPINLITSNDYAIYGTQTALRLVSILFTLIYIDKSKYLSSMKNKTNWWALLILLPTIIVLPNNFYYLAFEGNLLQNNYENIYILRFFLTLSVACSEELIFRKVMFDNIHIKNNLLKILLTAGIFGLMHIIVFLSTFNPFDLIQIVYTFGIGVILGFIYTYGKNIYVCIIYHFLFNLLNSDLYQMLSTQEIRPSFFIIAVIVGFITGLILLFEYLFYFYKKEKLEQTSN